MIYNKYIKNKIFIFFIKNYNVYSDKSFGISAKQGKKRKN